MALKKKQLDTAYGHLEKALALYAKATEEDRELAFLTVSKAFEVLVEYAWKDLKRRIEDEGLDAPSPKEAIRQSARLGFITDPDQWIASINARNDSVHDYFNIPEKDYLEITRNFLSLVDPLLPSSQSKVRRVQKNKRN